MATERKTKKFAQTSPEGISSANHDEVRAEQSANSGILPFLSALAAPLEVFWQMD